jgi:integrase
MKAKIKASLFPKAYSNGEFPVFIRIYFNGKSSYIKSGYSIPSGAWNEEKAELWESMPSLTSKLKESLSKEQIKTFRAKQKEIILLPNAFKINSEIRNTITKLEEINSRFELDREEISSEILKRAFENKDKSALAKRDFLEFIKQIVDKKYQQKQIRTSEKYNVLLNKLKDFQNDKPLSVNNLTSDFLNKFKLYLEKQGYHNNYVHTLLKCFRTIIQKEAIREEKVFPPDKNPFLFFSMPNVIPSEKAKLNDEEISRIEALELNEKSLLFHIKNVFLFSLYNAGIRIGDLLQLRWENIQQGRLIYQMGKTSVIKNIKLYPKPLEILKYYELRKENESDYIFPFIKNEERFSKLITPEDFRKASPELVNVFLQNLESKITICNKGLKEIAKEAKINKVISNHIARHSFSDIARKKGISVYDISKMLGHGNISITQRYLDSLDYESQDRALQEIFATSESESKQ